MPDRSTRRDFLRTTAAALGGALAAGRAPADGSPEVADSPNILFILIDQLTASTLSCYGGPVPTPQIASLARRGVLFEQATCPTPFCSPTRASIVTGRFPHHHGVVLNCAPRRQDGITPDDITTERLLSEHGYQTNFYGKWHLNGEDLPYYPDMYRPAEYQKEMTPFFQEVRQRDPETWMAFYNWALPVTVDPALRRAVDAIGDRWKDQNYADFIANMGRLEMPLDEHWDVKVTDLAIDRLRRLDDRPFMLTASLISPHDPNIVPAPYYDMFDPKDIELPANWQAVDARYDRQWSREIVAALGEPGLREFLRVYYAMVKLIDDQVGRLLAALRETGRADNTIVVFTADHGDMCGGHGMVWKSTDAFFDEIARVPLIISYPPAIRPGRTDAPACMTDLAPTLLELTGVPIPEHVQGGSLVPVMQGGRRPVPQCEYTFSERVRPHPEARREVLPGTLGSFMIRGEGWKYIRNHNRPEMLYHLAEDPGETQDRAGDIKYAYEKQRLSREMDEWLRRTGFPL